VELEYNDNSRRSKYIIVLGVAMALLAGGGAFFLINQAQQQGSGGAGELVPVVVAARSIPERHTITPADLAVAQVPVDLVGTGTFSDPSKLLARISAVAILPGQPIAANLIASTAEGGQFSILKPDETISPDSPAWRAVSITVAPDLAVGGLLQAGMNVDVFLTATVAAPASAEPSGRYVTDKSTKVVYQDIEILARDKDFYVIRLPEQQAEEILHLQATAAVTIGLALRPSEDTRTADATKLGETTNLIIARYGLPVPQTIVVGPGGATSVNGGQSYSGYQPGPSPTPSATPGQGAAASPSAGP
jgi:Flp pilus assembly protein CpaB